MFSKYLVKRPNGIVLEEFNTREAAEAFVIIMKKKYKEDLTIVTDDEHIETEGRRWDLDPDDLVEPEIKEDDYSADIDDFAPDESKIDFENLDDHLSDWEDAD